ncbi:MAG: hypothetical protein JO316_05300 [Abitibacteriaceae bacterium]|nr:hypothetical protein [Abditibacteriaceae bacterium]
MYWNIAPTTLKPFTPETNYMSLPGYLRFRTYPQAYSWMTRIEAEVAVYLEGYGQYTQWKSVASDGIEKAYNIAERCQRRGECRIAQHSVTVEVD